MNRRNLLKKLPSCLLGALFVAGVTSTTVNAVDGTPYLGLFELDGNIVDLLDSTAPIDPLSVGHDWESLHTGVGLVGTLPSTMTDDPDTAGADIIVADPAPKSIFTQGGSKDVSDVSKWKHTNGAVPDKDDITNAYAAAYTNPSDYGPHKAGDLIVYFGLDRYANNGDANAGFWFFQNEVHAAPNGTFVDGAGNPAVHVALRDDPDSADPNKLLPGDVFVIVKYPQGSNAIPIIKVYEWDPLDADHDGNADPSETGGKFSPLDRVSTPDAGKCDQAGSALVCAITNLGNLPAPPAGWNYTPKAGSGVPFESFYEGGINMTQVLGSTPCFASFLAETRSSESQTAQLKDFVLASFPVCGIDVTKDCSAQLNTSGTAVDVTFDGILDNTGGSSYIAYLKDDQSGSSIDDVCVDLGEPGCADDAPVPGLVLQSDGSAYFPLTGGAIVRYEGSYSISGVPNPPLVDIVSALAFGTTGNVPASGAEPNPALVIVSDTASASCSFDVDLGLTVVKNCSLAFINGDSVELTVSGTVTNTSDVPLSNVALSDVPFGSLTLSTGDTLAKGETGNFSQTFSLAYGAVFAGETDLGGGLTQVNLSHSDTVTAQGEALAGDGTSMGVTSDSDDANCTDFFTRGIDVSKACDQVILEPDINGRLVVKVKITATVSNIGEEDLSGIVLSDNPAVVFEPYATSLAAGASPFTVDGYYYPTSAVDLTNLTPLEFSDTVSVSANGVFSSGEAADSADVDCPLCPTP